MRSFLFILTIIAAACFAFPLWASYPKWVANSETFNLFLWWSILLILMVIGFFVISADKKTTTPDSTPSDPTFESTAVTQMGGSETDPTYEYVIVVNDVNNEEVTVTLESATVSGTTPDIKSQFTLSKYTKNVYELNGNTTTDGIKTELVNQEVNIVLKATNTSGKTGTQEFTISPVSTNE
jgi:hypothetical protein